ncbi:hypothetical protein IU449_26925 [Nocardia higoensis]|uniref:RES domain-containing protein n=1 Tax=Nocardia higoensis TaxID=228599 RepID=A0ABS0DI47_9NOCA|nr:hypothetical protein [Nocardia higoensis]MBF6358134.1 hypothetical protein [Nocardia higoensis]
MTNNPISARLMHYQAQPLTLDRTRVYEQSNPSTFTKPVGFWVSVEGEQDWPAWCTSEDYGFDSLAVAHEVRITDTANIRYITSVSEMDAFGAEFVTPTDFDVRRDRDRRFWGIGWQQVAARYDGIMIAPYQWERRYGAECEWYYTWDCASGCIWNLDAIESVTVVSAVTA